MWGCMGHLQQPLSVLIVVLVPALTVPLLTVPQVSVFLLPPHFCSLVPPLGFGKVARSPRMAALTGARGPANLVHVIKHFQQGTGTQVLLLLLLILIHVVVVFITVFITTITIVQRR